MSTVKNDPMPKPSHQPDLGGKQQPITGKGKVDVLLPQSTGLGKKPDVPVLGK